MLSRASCGTGSESSNLRRFRADIPEQGQVRFFVAFPPFQKRDRSQRSGTGPNGAKSDLGGRGPGPEGGMAQEQGLKGRPKGERQKRSSRDAGLRPHKASFYDRAGVVTVTLALSAAQADAFQQAVAKHPPVQRPAARDAPPERNRPAALSTHLSGILYVPWRFRSVSRRSASSRRRNGLGSIEDRAFHRLKALVSFRSEVLHAGWSYLKTLAESAEDSGMRSAAMQELARGWKNDADEKKLLSNLKVSAGTR